MKTRTKTVSTNAHIVQKANTVMTIDGPRKVAEPLTIVRLARKVAGAHIITPYQLAASGTEHGQQAALILWARVAMHLGFEQAAHLENYKPGMLTDKPVIIPGLKWLHAIPNGGGRSIATATSLKAEGVKSGVLDLFLPFPVKVIDRGSTRPPLWKHGLYIEMKRPKTTKAKGRTSSKQDEFKTDMRALGYVCAVCYTWIEAASTVEAYMLGEIQ